jgi:hypothetical protein
MKNGELLNVESVSPRYREARNGSHRKPGGPGGV